MTIANGKTVFTPDDLLAMPDAAGIELVGGALVEKNVSFESSMIAMIIGRLLLDYAMGRNLGHVGGPDCSYQCFPDHADEVRKPDVSFVRTGRIDATAFRRGHVRVAPDLAIEVLSPNDLAYEVDDKTEQYLNAGVQEVWIVSPRMRSVRIHRRDRSIANLRETDTLTTPVLPGFSTPVAAMFPPPPSTQG